LELKDIAALAKALAPAIRDYVGESIQRLKSELDGSYQSKFDDVCSQLKSVEAKAVDQDELLSKAQEIIEASGLELRLYVDAEVKKSVPAIDMGAIKAELNFEERLAEVRAEIPAPVEIPLIDYDEITKNLDLSFPIEEIQPLIDAAVAESAGKMQPPAVGPLDFAKLIDESVAKAFAAIPRPKDGENGKDADPEEIQKMVDSAVSAIEIKHGSDGIPGRDGLDIDILPEIDPEKSYPRGTYAQHQGGLWRSHCKTHGMKGWECVVDGISDIGVDFGDDPRQVTIRTVKSSGIVVEKQIFMPVVVDKGVYKKDSGYQKGDGVTSGGNFWIAQKDNPEGAPGTTPDWRLAVKKGRDAPRGDK